MVRFSKILFVLLFFLFLKLGCYSQIADNNLLLAKTFNSMNLSEKVLELSDRIAVSQLSPDFLFEKSNALYSLQQYHEAITIATRFLNPNQSCYLLSKCYARLNITDSAALYLAIYLNQPHKLPMSKIKSDAAFSHMTSSKPWIQLWETNWYSGFDEQMAEARYLVASNKTNDALFLLDEICRKYKSNHEAYALKAQIYLDQQNFDDALKTIQLAINKNSRMAEYYYLESVILLEKKHPRNAMKSINNALAIDNSQLDFYVAKARILHANNEDTASFTLLEQMLEQFPENQKLLENAGDIYSESGAYLQALTTINKLMVHKANPQLIRMRADIYFKAKSWSLALMDYTMWLDFFPNDGAVYFQRGWCYFYQQQYSEACYQWQKARQMGFVKADEALKDQCR